MASNNGKISKLGINNVLSDIRNLIEQTKLQVAVSVNAGMTLLQFATTFPDITTVTPLVTQLSWSHFLQVISIDDELKRNFYLTMAADQHWSKRTLKAKIDGMLYERTALAKQPEEVIRRYLELLRNERKMSPDIAFHDPYFLDFLGLEDDFSEKDLESAIVSELQKFITEMGNDFTFMARQKRISVDDEDFV